MNAVSLYRPGNSFFHRCDSRTKLCLILVFAVLVFLFENPTIPLVLTLGGICINLSAVGKYALTNVLFKMVIIIMLFSFVLHGFVNPAGRTPALFGSWMLSLPYFGTYMLEGAYLGLTFGLRIVCIGQFALLYISTTHPQEMINGLKKLKIPPMFCFMISMSFQLIPISTREAKIILAAQRARGLVERTLWDRVKGLVPMFVPLVVSSIDRMETLSMSLESRAFGAVKNPTPLFEVRFSKGDAAIIGLSVLAIAAAVFVRVRFGSLNWGGELAGWGQVFWPGLR